MHSSTPTVCVFCASSTRVSAEYTHAAQTLANILVNNGFGIRYGGGSVGLMGAIADTVLSRGGLITGIIPEFMVEREWQHPLVTNMMVVETMAERKKLLIEGVAAIVTLPGSTGTLEELIEVISLKKLGQIDTPIIIINTKGFFNPLLEMLRRMVDEQFMPASDLTLYTVIDHPEQIIDAMAMTSVMQNEN